MNWFRRMMIGRNGGDLLGNYILGVGFIFSVLAFALNINVLNVISTGLLACELFRMFSRNIHARQQENLLFMRFLYGIKAKYIAFKNSLFERKTHKFYKCPNCKQKLRVPKGKGVIKITCPKCKSTFQKKS